METNSCFEKKATNNVTVSAKQNIENRGQRAGLSREMLASIEFFMLNYVVP